MTLMRLDGDLGQGCRRGIDPQRRKQNTGNHHNRHSRRNTDVRPRPSTVTRFRGTVLVVRLEHRGDSVTQIF